MIWLASILNFIRNVIMEDDIYNVNASDRYIPILSAKYYKFYYRTIISNIPHIYPIINHYLHHHHYLYYPPK